VKRKRKRTVITVNRIRFCRWGLYRYEPGSATE